MAALMLAASGLRALNATHLAVFRWVTILLVAAIAGVVGAGIFWRYALNSALSWYEEVAKFLMVWMVFTGAPLASQAGAHAAIEMFPNVFPRRSRQLVLMVIALSIAALMAGLMQQGWRFALNAWTQVALTVGDLSMFWIFVAIPIGCAGMGLVSVELALRAFIGFVRPPEIPPDRSAEQAGQWGV
jgi:TRAP-type C4-dicarboxylate transport system permease small subunit